MQKVIRHTKSLTILPILALLIVGAMYIDIYINNVLNNSFAVSHTGGNVVTVQDDTTLSISFVDDDGNLAGNMTNIVLQPTAGGVFNSGNVNVNVDTNSPYGYTLTMSAATSSLSRSAAVNGEKPIIPTLTSAVSQSDFPNNFWGYKRSGNLVSDTNYQPMRANYNIPISSTATNASSSISTVNFGVKLNTDTPSGNYNISIDFLAVINVAPNLAYMQDATSTSLAAAMPNIGDSTVLYDRRDNQEYTVAKLADGKYWMTKNLNLAGGTALTSEDTDMPSTWTLPIENGFQEGNKLPESSRQAFIDDLFQNDDNALLYNSGNNTDSCGSGCYSYYSWTAATLGSGVNIADINATAMHSICPKGWRLPTSANQDGNYKTTDLYQLAIAYGATSDSIVQSTQLTAFYQRAGAGTAPNFLLSGRPNGNDGGYIWSATSAGGAYAFNMHYTQAKVSAVGDNGRARRYGLAVRCLFDATMQNFTQADADAMALHQDEVLVDARDGKTYHVTKLKDGNVWMTQNLDLNLNSSVALTSENTDLNTVSSWTPSATTVPTSNAVINTTFTSESECRTASNTGFASTYVNSDTTPMSADAGDRYILPKILSDPNVNFWDNGDTIYNSFAECKNADVSCNDHYAIGNYYNFSAAVASNDTSGETSSTAMPNSICPAGWRLPQYIANSNNDFYSLMLNYGITVAAFNPTGLNAIRQAPIYFTRSGYLEQAELGCAGTNSNYFFNMANNTVTHYFGFYGTTLYEGDVVSRYLGLSIRCILRTE